MTERIDFADGSYLTWSRWDGFGIWALRRGYSMAKAYFDARCIEEQ